VIALIDIDLGNIRSVAKALESIDTNFEIINNTHQLENKYIEGIIFPGTGSFNEASKRIYERGFAQSLKTLISNNTPFLGICLGMQLLFESGNEGGLSEGLGLIKGNVNNFKSTGHDIRIPHVGWNNVNIESFIDHIFFECIENNSDFYFVHSFFVSQSDKDCLYGFTHHGIDFPSVVIKENIFGVQFHPEKSQTNGIQILKNFKKICLKKE